MRNEHSIPVLEKGRVLDQAKSSRAQKSMDFLDVFLSEIRQLAVKALSKFGLTAFTGACAMQEQGEYSYYSPLHMRGNWSKSQFKCCAGEAVHLTWCSAVLLQRLESNSVVALSW